jgi:hypothetical protein
MNNFGEAYDVQIMSREHMGTTVIIRIPEHFDGKG